MTVRHRYTPALSALAAGCIIAVASLFIPIGVMENFTASSGLSEIIPQTAPPLGATARLAMAFLSAVVAAGIVLALMDAGETSPPNATGRGTTQRGTNKRGPKEKSFMSNLSSLRLSGFGPETGAASSFADNDKPTPAQRGDGFFTRIKARLDALAGREGSDDRGIRAFEDLPRLNRADRHADAPPRRPILASADFADLGESLTGAQAEPEMPEPEMTQPEMTQPEMPAPLAARPVPMAARAPEPATYRPLGAATQPRHEDPVDTMEDGRPYADLDLNDLVDRLERRLRAAPSSAAAAPDTVAEPEPIDKAPAAEPVVAPSSEPPIDDAPLPPRAPRPLQAVPSMPAPQSASGDEMDEALRAALETLERMNRRSA